MHMAYAQNSETVELLKAQAHIWNHIFQFINSMSLKCAVELGMPDIIHRHGKAMALSELTKELPIINSKASFVSRLMRILIHSGFFTIDKSCAEENDREEAYLLTPACKLLLKDDPFSVCPFVISQLDPILTNPWQQLSQWFCNDDPSTFVTTHGVSFWELAAQNPKWNHSFNEGMASDARLVSRVLIEYFKHAFEGISSLVDVGGGTGTMAKAVADAYPNLKCIVLDLPHVVEGLESYKNVDFVAGDMFRSIPPADFVLLKFILHDWNDEDCVKILKKCKEAIPEKEKGGKVMIIDMVLDEQQEKGDDMATETQLLLDMLMMMVVMGRERTARQWVPLFFKAGFTGYKITPIFGLKSLIEVFY